MAESRPSVSPGTPVKWQAGSKTVFGTVVKASGSGYQVKNLAGRVSSIRFAAALAPTTEEWDAALSAHTEPAPAVVAPVAPVVPVAAEVPVAAPVVGAFAGLVAPAAAE